MSSEDHLATARVRIAADAAQVWNALLDPAHASALWHGASVTAEWTPGTVVTWSGEWEGKRYQDRGEVLAVEQDRLLRFTHFSPLSGEPDVPENHHTLTFKLSEHGNGTDVVLTQDNNPTAEAAAHSSAMWGQLLNTLRDIAEQR
ncbi:SRPBCC domain-containing protein [uncultured Microbacterium sp.]|uniref:SRPBCC family protein n=1 Tax=uncultured Microbacterium sp. TaxID=191216 RepID=UPI0025DD749B|nr:SRPBCC family protein [uncultured Microbacterium sp.]